MPNRTANDNEIPDDFIETFQSVPLELQNCHIRRFAKLAQILNLFDNEFRFFSKG